MRLKLIDTYRHKTFVVMDFKKIIVLMGGVNEIETFFDIKLPALLRYIRTDKRVNLFYKVMTKNRYDQLAKRNGL